MGACVSTSAVAPQTPLALVKPLPTHAKHYTVPQDIPHEHIRDINEDREGGIWVATQGDGVARLFNGATTVYSMDDGLLSNDTRSIDFDEYGGVWICTRGGVNYLHTDGSILSFNRSNTPIFTSDFFYTASIDGSGTVWAGNSSGHVFYYDWESTPHDSLTGQWKRFHHGITNASWIMDSLVEQGDIVWFGFNRGFALKIDTTTNDHTKFDLVSYGNENDTSLFEHEAYDIALHPEGGIIFLSLNAMAHIDEQVVSHTNFYLLFDDTITRPTDRKFIAGSKFAIHQLDSTNFLLGCRTGLTVFSDGHFQSIESISGFVQCIYESHDGSIWIGTRDGLYSINTPLWQLWNWTAGRWQIVQDEGDRLFLFMYDDQFEPHGHIFDQYSWKQVDFPKQEKFSDSIVMAEGYEDRYLIYHPNRHNYQTVIDDRLGFIKQIESRDKTWLISSATGAYFFRDDQLIEFPLLHNDKRVLSVFETDKETIWFGGIHWLEKWEHGQGEIIDPPVSPKNLDVEIHSIIEYQGQIWLATKNHGLQVRQNEGWRRVSDRDGLVGKSYHALFIDSNDTLWAGSESGGVSSFRDGRWVFYDNRDGLEKGRIDAFYEDGYGHIWVEIQETGLARLTYETLPPQVELASVPQNVLPGEPVFVTLTGVDPWHSTPREQLAYSWRIVDENSGESVIDWTPYSMSTSIRTPFLQPGRYRFEALAQDKSRNTSLTPASAIITVAPYLYSTPQFYIPVSLTSLATIITALLLWRNYKKLAESQFRYRNLLDKDEATLVANWDSKGRLIYCNESFEAAFEPIAPMFRDMTAAQWFGLVHANQAGRFDEAIRSAEKSLETPHLIEARAEHSGNEQWFLWRLRSTRPKGTRANELHAVAVDITLQKEAESSRQRERNQFIEFCDTAEVGLVRLDNTNQVTSMNDVMIRLISSRNGAAPIERWGGSDWLALADHVRTTKTTRSMSLKGVKLDGKSEFYSIVTAIARDEDVELMVFDYTEQKHLQDRFTEISAYEQQKLGRELHDGLGQLLAALSYMGAQLEERSQGQAPQLNRQAAELNRFLSQALEQTRLVSKGLNPYTLQSSGLKQALSDLFNSYQQVYPTLIHFRYDEGLELESLQTAEGLYRIIRECVFNALKHARAECITVTCEQKEGKQVFRIRDDGIGLPEDFDTKSSNGMGTRIMQYYADRISASLRWSSHKETGTEVVIELDCTS